MSQAAMDADERFGALVEALAGYPGVVGPGGDGPQGRRRFGSLELKTQGKIFAMLTRGRLVVKLPQGRVDALIASGDGARFDPRRDGRLMKEWLAVEPSSTVDWLALALEARAFVGAAR